MVCLFCVAVVWRWGGCYGGVVWRCDDLAMGWLDDGVGCGGVARLTVYDQMYDIIIVNRMAVALRNVQISASYE